MTKTEWFVTEGNDTPLYFRRKGEISGLSVKTIIAKVTEEAGEPTHIILNPDAEMKGIQVHSSAILDQLAHYYGGENIEYAEAYFNKQGVKVEVASDEEDFGLVADILSTGSGLGLARKPYVARDDDYANFINSLSLDQRKQHNKDLAAASRRYGVGGP